MAADIDAELAELRSRIERQIDEYVENLKRLDRLSRKLSQQRVVPRTYHDGE
jgi:hypothetical protein